MKNSLTVGIVAPSNPVPQVEFKLGLDQLRSVGIHPVVHPQCRKKHELFAGTDEQRARAFFDYACDSRLPIVWCARGGYGAVRLLPFLDRWTERFGVPPKKLLVGYSDITALHEYVRTRWRWNILHAPMPAMRRFCLQTSGEWESLQGYLRGESEVETPWSGLKLKWLAARPKGEIRADLVGGNLAVWTSLIGTSYEGVSRGRILFLEDVEEPLYRLDRMLQQLKDSRGFRGTKAVVLGNFLSCRDTVAQVLGTMPQGRDAIQRALSSPAPESLRPLRKKLDDVEGLRSIFAAFSKLTGVPVAEGLPVGHGPGIASLPLGAAYSLSAAGQLRLSRWGWRG